MGSVLRSINWNRFLASPVIFGLGHYAPRLVNFAVLPVYARLLSPVDFASLALIELSLAYFAMVVNSGFSNGMLRYYVERDSVGGQNQVFTTALLLVLGLGALLAVVMTGMASSVSDLIIERPGVREIASWLPAIALIAVCDAGNAILAMLFRVRDRSRAFLTLAVARVAIATALSVYLIVAERFGVSGFLIGNMVGSSICLFTCGAWLLMRNWVGPNAGLALDLLKFSAPYVPLGFIEMLAARAGLICLSFMGEASAIAAYALAEKLASAVLVAYGPIGLMMMPFMYKTADCADAPRIFSKLLTALAGTLGMIIILLAGFAEELIELVGGAAYHSAIPIVLPLAIASGFASLRPSVRIGLTIAKKTHYMPIVAAVAAALGFGVTWAIVHWLGVQGAAWGTALTALISLALAGYASQRFLRVPVNWAYLVSISILVVISVAILSAMPAFALPKGLVALLVGIGALFLLRPILSDVATVSVGERWEQRAAESTA